MAKPISSDTIVAISTPPGEGGLGIVRLSGPEAVASADRLFRGRTRPTEAASHTVHYGHVVDPSSGEVIEEVLLTVMRAPHTYTREDVVEISGHGGMFPLRRILEVAVSCGARLAEAGEFTRRAFLNGRINLAQAEAVIEIIRSRSDLELKSALGHLSGRLCAEVEGIRQMLIQLQAMLEAALEFPEDDLEVLPREQYASLCGEARGELRRLLARADEGRILREGLRVAIVGKTNVGKSSLFNALLDSERAIVTQIPGTTRDTLESWITLGGLSVCLLDTAGVKEARDQIESEALRRAEQAVEEADLVLVVVDASEPPTEEDGAVVMRSPEKKKILVLNKIDLGRKLDPELLPSAREILASLEVSALKRTGLTQLKKAMAEATAQEKIRSAPEEIVTSVRQTEALKRAAQDLDRAFQTIRESLSEEFIAVEVREALESLGEITGETTSEEILDRVFSEFCVGK